MPQVNLEKQVGIVADIDQAVRARLIHDRTQIDDGFTSLCAGMARVLAQMTENRSRAGNV